MLNYELLLKGGRVIDPSCGLDGVMDVAINGNRIAAIADDIPAEDGRDVIWLSEADIVTPGLIDMHVHCARGITRHSCDPDEIGIRAGVTTVADGGSVGSHTFIGFRTHVVSAAKTRVLCFLNMSFAGQARMPELRTPDDFDKEFTRQVIKENSDVICGIKARATMPAVETVGAQAIDLAHEVLDGLPLMLHIGDHDHSPRADRVAREMVTKMVKGDIITHVYTPFPGCLLDGDDAAPELEAGVKRGLVLDVGRGRMNFSFSVAQKLIAAGIRPDALSTDLTVMNRSLMVFCLTDTLSAFLNLGFSLPEVVEMATSKPASALGIAGEVGSLKVGMHADLSVLRHVQGEFEYYAQTEENFPGTQAVYATMCVRDGVPYESSPPPGSAGEAAKRLDSKPEVDNGRVPVSGAGLRRA